MMGWLFSEINTLMVARAFFIVSVACLICDVCAGQLLNPRFDIPDPNRATEWFTPPLHWDWFDTVNPLNLNYVGMHTDFDPEPEHGQTVNWSIPGPVEGDYFVLLSTGDAQGTRSETKTLYSSIDQTITLCPGDVLSGYYFFGTTDYRPYNDTALITLDPVDPNDPQHRKIVLVSISVDDVGSYNSTGDWQYFRHQFKTETCGQYVLYAEVRDTRDRIYKSYLALDNFKICRNVPPYGDYNDDCVIDLNDFNILSQAWFADCNDPNTIADPNIPCEPFIVDPNSFDPNLPHIIDLDYMLWISDYWLERFYK